MCCIDQLNPHPDPVVQDWLVFNPSVPLSFKITHHRLLNGIRRINYQYRPKALLTAGLSRV